MDQAVYDILKKYWGYEVFRPLQEKAIQSVLDNRDSIVVLPTGGGKSLCFQVPAMTLNGMAIVISPLISLMKDQVDALLDCGIPAGRLDSGQTIRQRNEVFSAIAAGALKLLYVSPERIFANGFIDYLKNYPLAFIAIDEAHCVSMWGHDFRPEYRQLGVLKKHFEKIAIHAYTATATKQVRDDIAKQLHLITPEVLVGSFDRPNLIYKVERRHRLLTQLSKILEFHLNESGIIYCIRRADVEDLCAQLQERGFNALPYHAGLGDLERKKNQEAFIQEKANIIVATVAFGMGIDKSNVRYVIHAGMPQSLEHYQQESGRGGRDGLDAECYLFYSGEDYAIWQSILRNKESAEARKISQKKLDAIYDFCTNVTCRHKAILQYFGESYPKPNCEACDVCTGDLDTLKDSLVTAQKILCCVKRLDERFGADYTAMVLTGSSDSRITENKHHLLSTFGLLRTFSKRIVRDWIEQLAAQDCLQKTGDYNTLQVTAKGWTVIKGDETPVLLKPVEKTGKECKTRKEKKKKDPYSTMDPALFERLRDVRRKIADQKNVPPFIIFGDESLRDMATQQPRTPAAFMQIHGVGERKCKQYAHDFITEIETYCRENA